MCQIRLLVIGNSARRNNEAIRRVAAECRSMGDDISVVVETVSPYTPGIFDTEVHDLALVDGSVISKGCSRVVLGSGLPILSFEDLSGETSHHFEVRHVLSGVVEEAVRLGRLRDYILRVTEHIDETRQMIAAAS